jgi:hypothetical protein
MDQPLPLDDLLVRSETTRYESLQTDLELSHGLKRAFPGECALSDEASGLSGHQQPSAL